MPVSTSIPTTVRLGQKHRLLGLIAAVAAVVAVAVWAIVAYAVDTSSSQQSSSRGHVRAGVAEQRQELLHQAMLRGFPGLASGVPTQRQELLHQAMLRGFPGLASGVPTQR